MHILNLVDSSLTALSKKGNLSHAEELYNPLDYFECVHHISFTPKDKNIALSNSTIRVHVLPLIMRKVPVIGCVVNIPVVILRLILICRQYNVRLIRGRGPFHASCIGLIVAKLLRIPFVVSTGSDVRYTKMVVHTDFPFKQWQWLRWTEEELVLKNADKVLCPSQYLRDYCARIGVRQEKLCIVPFRVKADIMDDTDTTADTGIAKPIVLCVSRLEKEKQVEFVIDAMPLVCKDYPNTQFVFVGDGTLRQLLKGKVNLFGLSKSACFTGYKPGGEVKAWIKRATIVCIPMSGFVILEAAARNKPIVAFDVEWHSEFIKNGNTGLLVENKNVGALASAIKQLLSDPVYAARLGNNAGTLFRSEYAPERVARRELNVLVDCVEKFSERESD